MKLLHINTQPIYLNAVLICDPELSSHWHLVDNSSFITAIEPIIYLIVCAVSNCYVINEWLHLWY